MKRFVAILVVSALGGAFADLAAGGHHHGHHGHHDHHEHHEPIAAADPYAASGYQDQQYANYYQQGKESTIDFLCRLVEPIFTSLDLTPSSFRYSR